MLHELLSQGPGAWIVQFFELGPEKYPHLDDPLKLFRTVKPSGAIAGHMSGQEIFNTMTSTVGMRDHVGQHPFFTQHAAANMAAATRLGQDGTLLGHRQRFPCDGGARPAHFCRKPLAAKFVQMALKLRGISKH